MADKKALAKPYHTPAQKANVRNLIILTFLVIAVCGISVDQLLSGKAEAVSVHSVPAHPHPGRPADRHGAVLFLWKHPVYIFVLDRSTANGAADEGILGAQEVIENDLIKELDCYKEGKIIYFIRHANVWYTSTGGVQALDTMLADLEAALLG